MLSKMYKNYCYYTIQSNNKMFKFFQVYLTNFFYSDINSEWEGIGLNILNSDILIQNFTYTRQKGHIEL